MTAFQNPYFRAIVFFILWAIIVRDLSLRAFIPFMVISITMEVVWHIASKLSGKKAGSTPVDLFEGYGPARWYGEKILRRDPAGDIVIAGGIDQNDSTRIKNDSTRINIEDEDFFICVPNLSLTKRWADSGFGDVVVLNVLPYARRDDAVHYIVAFGMKAGSPETIMLVRTRRGVMFLLDNAAATNKIDIRELRTALRSMEVE